MLSSAERPAGQRLTFDAGLTLQVPADATENGWCSFDGRNAMALQKNWSPFLDCLMCANNLTLSVLYVP